MTISTDQYALLSQDAYNTHVINDTVTLDGVKYKVLDEVHDQATGYQGTAYLREDTGELVIAHCGTDTARMPVQDIGTDVGMVLTGINAQTADAEAFTKKAMELGRRFDQAQDLPFQATVTGHSLGGALAEITAYKFGLHGETFNAYGAAGLAQGIPAGGNQIIDNVRATDVVSAASQHFGEVRIYASQQDIDRLEKAGYSNRPGFQLANPIEGADLDAHGINNFTPNNPRLGHSIISPENAALYQANKEMIDSYRGEVLAAREVISAGWEVPYAIVHGVESAAHDVGEKIADGVNDIKKVAGSAYDATVHTMERAEHAVSHAASEAYTAVSQRLEQGAHAVAQEGKEVVQDVEQGFGRLSQAGHDVLSRIDRLLEASQKGDSYAARQENQALAAMPAGQQMQAAAVAAANQQAQLEQQHAAQQAAGVSR
jgi:pimeloyl-ACP methyl ester carboxylesterase